MKTIQVYSDPGHAWAKVPLKELFDLGIAYEISSFSYVRQQSLSSGLNIFVYLEEDCDLGIYLKALRERNIEYKFKESHTNKRSKIRGYNTFMASLYLRLMENSTNALKGF